MPLDDTQRDVVRGHARRLLEGRQWPKTICPSEIARALSRGELDLLGASDWRDTMDHVRQMVWEMRERGQVELLQKGKVIPVESLAYPG